MTEDVKQNVISAGTWIPLGSLLGILVIVVSSVLWFSGEFAHINSRITDLEYTVLSKTQYRYDSNNAKAAWMEFCNKNRRNDGSVFVIPDIPQILSDAKLARDGK